MSKRKIYGSSSAGAESAATPPNEKHAKPSPNADICDILLELADYEKNVTRMRHKYNAYRKAAAELAKLPNRIQNAEEAKGLPGIGVKIGEKIQEILTTGQLAKAEKIRHDDTNLAIQELTAVSGIGPVHARKLVEEGISTVQQLRDNADKLTHHQKIGLKYFDNFAERIPRDEMQKLEGVVCERVKALDGDFLLTVCGSYRRGMQTSGDIDVLLTHPSFTSATKTDTNHLLGKVVKALEVNGFVTDTLSQGNSKFMGVCRLNKEPPTKFRRIDIRLIPHDEYWCGILYFTGSDEFNRQMRSTALEKGYTLNEYSLRKIGSKGTPGEPIPISSEKDVFDYLGMDYREPNDRSL